MGYLPLSSNHSRPALNIPLVSRVSYVLGEGIFQDILICYVKALQNVNENNLLPGQTILSLIKSLPSFWRDFQVL